MPHSNYWPFEFYVILIYSLTPLPPSFRLSKSCFIFEFPVGSNVQHKFVHCRDFKKLIKFYAANMIPRGIHKWNSLLAYSCSRLKSNSDWHIDIGLINYDTNMHYLYCIYSSNEILRFRKIINTFRVNNLGIFCVYYWSTDEPLIRAYEVKKHCRYIFCKIIWEP